MFWSGNFMAVRELNFLLKEENVTLASVLEADDILQECKADNKALMQFLTRPDILAELITLITEEPPKNVELSQQYRHASIACEVLTSHLSTLSDRLTLDTAQMNRLCDFINKDPPLNPLLASYFSKTVEMLLERSPKQDWYLYHIVCLRVLDFFKSRRDFLPNLLRHISTSAIADTFKYLIRLDDLFNKPIMEWLEEHQFIDSLVQIVCGSYVAERFPGAGSDEPEKGQREPSEKELHDAALDRQAPHPTGSQETSQSSTESPPSNRSPQSEELSAEEKLIRAERISAVAASNAAALLCDLVATGCAGEGCSTRSRTAWQLAGALGGCACVRGVLCHVFTCAPRHRARALLHAAALLRVLLLHHTSENEEERCSVELAVAPHLPLLHQALLHDPAHYAQEEETSGSAGDGAAPPVGGGKRVGAARVSTAALVAQLALSEVEEVATTLLTLGTPSVLVDMLFEFPDNNFLHAQVVALCRHALSNRLYRTQYARHLFVECDLLTRLMDAFEDNEHKLNNSVRCGYMGHVLQLLGCVAAGGALDEMAQSLQLAAPLLARWAAFRDTRLHPVLLLHDTPLGGTYPSDNIYEAGEELDNIADTLAANYDFSDMAATSNMDDLGDDLASDHEMMNVEKHTDSSEFIADGLGLGDSEDKRVAAQSSFLELASQRFDDDMWDDAPEAEEPGHSSDASEVWSVPAWESDGGGGAEQARGAGGAGRSGGAGGEGWAQFDAFAAPPGAFATPPSGKDSFSAYWPSDHDAECDGDGALEQRLRALRLEAHGAGLQDAGLQDAGLQDAGLQDASCSELANNLLTAMSAMTPAAIAHIVNANVQPLPLQPPEVSLPPEATVEVTTPNPVTPPAEFGNPPAHSVFPSETSLPFFHAPPADVTSVEVNSVPGESLPAGAPETLYSSDLQDKALDKIEVNCITPNKDSGESESPATEIVDSDPDDEGLSPDDNVVNVEKASTAVESQAIEVSGSPQSADTSER